MEQPDDSELIVLDPEGELILVVGYDIIEDDLSDDDIHMRRLRVSSKTLCLASSVFAAMLGPDFKEGQQLREYWRKPESSGCPPTITLGEDDAVAMDIILSALHFKINRVKDFLSARVIAKIAIHSDKYDLNGALNPWVNKWCDHQQFPLRAWSKLRDMGYGILAAYFFRSPKLEAMSAQFVKDMPPDFADTWKDDRLLEHLPEEVRKHLADQISGALSRLRCRIVLALDHIRSGRSIVLNNRERVISCTKSFAKDGTHNTKPCDSLYLDALHKVGIWPSLYPFEVLSVNKAVHLIKEALKLADHECSLYSRSAGQSRGSCPFLWELDLVALSVDRIQRKMKGFSRPELR